MKSQEFSFDNLRVLFNLLSTASTQMKQSPIAQLPLELAIIAYAYDQQDKKEEAKEEEVSVRMRAPRDVSDLRKQIGLMKKQDALVSAPAKDTTVLSKKVETPSGDLLKHDGSGEVTNEWLADFWKAFIIRLKDHNHTISGVLRGCNLRSFDKKTLVITTAYAFHKERLSEQKTLMALENAASILTGNPVTVAIELKK